MTHRGTIKQSYGGVGRNLGDALARLHCRPFLISAVGDDNYARALTNHNPLLERRGLKVVKDASTAVYCVVLDQLGEALFGVGDMTIHDYITPTHVRQFEGEISKSPLVVVDGNLPQLTINYILDLCASCHVPVWYEPTDIQKVTKPWLGGRGDNVTFTSPNMNELGALCSHLGLVPTIPGKYEDLPQMLQQVLTTASPLLHTMHALMVTLGPYGFMILRRASPNTMDDPLLPVTDICPITVTHDEVVGLHFPGPQNPKIISVSGAGDCLAAGFIAGMLNKKSVSECGALGRSAAKLSLAASPAVPHTLSPDALPWGHHEVFTTINRS
ncbi:pseudouridine kinase-like isoform X2 [Homarus americanus]|uniref:pseudouridine kinase-like isoform X2 n=1 Tax=Homarus americanus TaxID=6706 RepID=UPI001C49543B|nr:pseudouridine kinase-like isoform X2 [Homarus americanus]